MSWLRARCPDCRTLTAVWVGDGYECHACGRSFPVGVVRVPRAHGTGGEAMERAASLPLPYPDAATVASDSLEEQIETQLEVSPPRPLVLGGCCCAHLGAIARVAREFSRELAVVWLDAHGDLNTPATSPSGNAWGMPLRMAIDRGFVGTTRVALVGARNLDPAERAFMAAHGIDDDVDRALAGAAAVYVAFDVDVLAPGEVACFMPEPGGPMLGEALDVLRRIAGSGIPVAGAGFTGLRPEADPEALVSLATALGL